MMIVRAPIVAAFLPAAAIAQSLPAPRVVTQPQDDNSNRTASTAYVDRSSSAVLSVLAGKAPLASPTFSGAVKADKLQILGSGSTGDASTFTVPSAGLGIDTTLATLLGNAHPRVATNVALKAVALPYSRIRRDGFYAAGDGGAMDYTWSASNCAKADDGAQVQPTGRTGCWIADPGPAVFVEAWGARGNGTSDDGPPIRAACAYGAASGKLIRVLRKGYLLASLDPSGLGALVLGTGANGPNAASCDMAGDGTSLLPDNAYVHGPFFKLGDGLNRPLVYIHRNTRNPIWTGFVLSGNRPGQTGWAGGPNGKLFTVQLADEPGAGSVVESGMTMRQMVMRDGYNGNLYLGSGRGGLWLTDTWSQYSGQTTDDYSIWLNGYDATLINTQAGSNAGDGVFASQGSQYQFIGGAYFLNGARGMRINGNKVQHLVATSINYQGNKMEGVSVLNSAPYSGSQGGMLSFNSVVFEGNSGAGSGQYSDIKVDTNRLVTMTAPGFPGRIVTSGGFVDTLPKYNVEIVGNSRVAIAGASLGSNPGVGTSFTDAFTNNCALLTGDVPVTCTWTPVLRGDTTAGTPAYARQYGSYTRAGNTITASFNIDVSSLGGAAGSVIVGGLPLFSQANTADYGSCALSSWGGWTAPVGKSSLGAFVTPSSTTIYFVGNGTNASGSDVATFAQFSASTRLWGTCTYRVAN